MNAAIETGKNSMQAYQCLAQPALMAFHAMHKAVMFPDKSLQQSAGVTVCLLPYCTLNVYNILNSHCWFIFMYANEICDISLVIC